MILHSFNRIGKEKTGNLRCRGYNIVRCAAMSAQVTKVISQIMGIRLNYGLLSLILNCSDNVATSTIPTTAKVLSGHKDCFGRKVEISFTGYTSRMVGLRL